MQRRNFMKAMLAGAALTASPAAAAAQGPSAADDRADWCNLLDKIAEPVLSRMAQGRLQKTMTVEVSPVWDGRDRRVAYMECFARLIAGLSPWLSLPADDSAEGLRRRRLTAWAQDSYAHAVDPKSPDYLLWRKEGQALVDSAYFTNALLRAPKQLWEPLDKKTKARIVTEIKGLRRFAPPYTNWLLFAAMNEAFLLKIGEACDLMRIDFAVKKMNEWYTGDGWYTDGDRFHYDYYNSYVIHPMLVEVLDVLAAAQVWIPNTDIAALHASAQKRMQRFGEHLERMIGPDGSYPPIGRSLTYRTAAFQPLSLLALRKQLPEKLKEGRVRAALSAVHRRIFADPSNFDADGFLTIGFVGHQPALGDWYSNNGSMYITSESFLALGLPATDSFWTAAAEDWTAKKAFTGQPFDKDYPVDY